MKASKKRRKDLRGEARQHLNVYVIASLIVTQGFFFYFPTLEKKYHCSRRSGLGRSVSHIMQDKA